jgi:peptidoglycan/xylan/chitin deacetylase (PgdA/CDA1 family)
MDSNGSEAGATFGRPWPWVASGVAVGLGVTVVAHGIPSIAVLGAIAGARSPGRLGSVWLHGSRDKDAAALTFDDGPSPETTPRILRQLDLLRLRATFFVSGAEVARHPRIIEDITSAGHGVESHGMEHRHHLLHGPRWVRHDLDDAVNALRSVGVTPRYFRPPYGQATTATVMAARHHDLVPVLWSCWGREFAQPSAEAVAARVRHGLVAGSVVLLHDSDQFCGEGSAIAVEGALPAIADELKRRRLRTATVSEILS